MKSQPSPISCGVRQVYELWNLNSREDDRDIYGDESFTGHVVPAGVPAAIRPLVAMLKATVHQGFSTIVFSDADMEGNGKALERAILSVFSKDWLVSVSNVNPNSSNRITTWVWAPDWLDVAKWADGLRTENERKNRVFTKEAVTDIRCRWAEEYEDRDGDDNW